MMPPRKRPAACGWPTHCVDGASLVSSNFVTISRLAEEAVPSAAAPPPAAASSPSAVVAEAVPGDSAPPVSSHAKARVTLEDQLRGDWDDINTKLMQAPHRMMIDPDLLAGMLGVFRIE